MSQNRAPPKSFFLENYEQPKTARPQLVPSLWNRSNNENDLSFAPNPNADMGIFDQDYRKYKPSKFN